MKACVFVGFFSAATAQSAGSLTKEVHPPLSYSVCKTSGCKKYDSSVVIDSNWRWTHKKGETTNCYTGNQWDLGICPDVATCTSNCEIEGADKEYANTYGVVTNGDKLSLQFVTEGQYTTNIGSRLYLLDQRHDNKYKMFNLKNREFTFTVDDAEMGCGLNGALYFVGMDADGGSKRWGNAGANFGTGYCDAQCPHDLKWINGEANVEDWVPSETDENAGRGKYGTCCTEVDLWEANKMSMAFTMHSCTTPHDLQYRCVGDDCGDNGEARFKGVCDKNGCDMQAWRFGVRDFFGPGDKFHVNSKKPVTVTTQFVTDDGTDDGTIVEARQFYTQNGKTFEHKHYALNGRKHDSITDSMCSDWVAETKDGTNFLEKGGMKAVDTVFKNGAVLVMSLWDDHYANMLWLDSKYPIDGTCDTPGVCRGSCSITSGLPADVEAGIPNATIRFSDIKYGHIGTTMSMSSVSV